MRESMASMPLMRVAYKGIRREKMKMLIKLMIRRCSMSLLPTLIIKMDCSSISNSNMLINNESYSNLDVLCVC